MSREAPIGQLLRGMRESRGESLRTTARNLEVDPSYLSKIERGNKPAPAKLRERLANYYDADPEELAIAEGLVPADIAEILMAHPEAIEELRRRYGPS